MRVPWARGCSSPGVSPGPAQPLLLSTCSPRGPRKEGVHREINIWAVPPVIQKILLCLPPSPPKPCCCYDNRPHQTGAVGGIPINPFLTQQGPLSHQVACLRGLNATKRCRVALWAQVGVLGARRPGLILGANCVNSPGPSRGCCKGSMRSAG